MRLVGLTVVAAMTAASACATPRPAFPDPGLVEDAPYQLEDDLDLAEQRDWMWSLPPGAPELAAVRAGIAAQLVDRAVRYTDLGRLHLAHELLLDLAGLWQGDAAGLGAGLGPYRDALASIAATFRRAGADAEVVTALALRDEALALAPPARGAELDEALGFLDDLGVAEHGDIGLHARALRALTPIVEHGAPDWLVDRFVERLLARQRLVMDQLIRGAATYATAAAHYEVVRTTRLIATALARAGRADQIAAAIRGLDGVGADRALAELAAAVAAPGATARDWVQLAAALRREPGNDGGELREESDDEDGDPNDDDGGGDRSDPISALGVCLAGIVRFPDDATLLAAAADHATAAGRLQQPIALLRAVRRRTPDDLEVAQRLGALYRERLGQLAHGGRPVATRALLGEIEAFYAQLDHGAGADHARWRTELAQALATAGRGLVDHGLLDEAIGFLERSIELAPAMEAYETLGTIALKRERWREARAHFAAGLALPDETAEARYAHAKLLRLAGDAAAGGGDLAAARRHWLHALSRWIEIIDKLALPRPMAGEARIEIGRILWHLGDHDRAIEHLEEAIDRDPDGGETYVQVVSFFLLAERFSDAIDAFHRALGSDRVGDYYKVYMSLWIVAEARRRREPPDPLALDYLRSRDGPLWHDRLARLATGRESLAAVRAHATTRARRAELAYYIAVLEPGGARTPAEKRALFDAVIATDMIMFFEYDMARQWSRAHPVAPPR